VSDLPEALPVIAFDGRSIPERVVANDEWDSALYEAGAVLFRGFGVTDVGDFESAITALTEPDAESREESSPRSAVGAKAFTSTEYPPEYPIQPHNEFSYRARYPHRLVFGCVTPAEEGGATPLADCRRVLDALPADVIERFERDGVLYVRNFAGLGVSWQDAFGTTSKEDVEQYCRDSDIEFTWTKGGLRTTQRRPAVVAHPVTGDRAWFNHALIWNVHGTEPREVREALLKLPGELVPTNSYYGDGATIEEDVIEELRRAYAAATIRFRWEAGDVLLVDNVLTAHGRDSFTGERRILVGMGNAPARRADASGVVGSRADG
jgi:alpha-ketoglutarate-dependent taurine dioxygenase